MEKRGFTKSKSRLSSSKLKKKKRDKGKFLSPFMYSEETTRNANGHVLSSSTFKKLFATKKNFPSSKEEKLNIFEYEKN